MNTQKLRKAVAGATAVIATMGISLDTLAATKADHDKEVIGYVTQWDPWKDSAAGVEVKGMLNHMNVPVDKYTILNWSFFGVAKDGSLHSGDYKQEGIYQEDVDQEPMPLLHTIVTDSWDMSFYFGEVEALYWADSTHAARLETQGLTADNATSTWAHPASGISGDYPIPLKIVGGAPGVIDYAHASGSQVMASLGGWSMSKHFPEMAADPVKRATFIADCVRLIDMGFDGIDIDWEYPGDFGMNIFSHDPRTEANGGRTIDHENFELLMRDIRAAIGPDKLITAAFSADIRKLSGFDWAELDRTMDAFNMMTYDYSGGWSNNAGHNSPLYDYPGSGIGQDEATAAVLATFNWDSLASWMIGEGIPSEKINMGLAYYGRSVDTVEVGMPGSQTIKRQVTLDPDGPASTALDEDWAPYDGTPSYRIIEANKAGWTENWDDSAKVPYLNKGGKFLSYDNERSVGLKAEYVVDHNLGGVIIWVATGDLDCSQGGITGGGDTNLLPICGSPSNPLMQKFTDVLATHVTSSSSSSSGSSSSSSGGDNCGIPGSSGGPGSGDGSGSGTAGIPCSDVGVDSDFNGDGIADIFWRNTNGSAEIAISNSSGVIESLNNKSTDWTAQLGDFNGDGAKDTLWRDSITGAVKVAISDASGNQGAVHNLAAKGSAWQTYIGDFNADGRDDILWRKPSVGTVAVGISDANGDQDRLESFFAKGAAWEVFVGDFNGDGGDDMLWRRGTDGSSKIVFTDANGMQANVVNAVPFKRFTAWQVQVADFNGDGRDDIFWRKSSDGTVKVGISGADGKQQTSVNHFAKFMAWTADLGDFNGDGGADILWRKASDGTVKVAISSALGGQERAENLNAKFSAWSHHLLDFNGDGRSDILWHKSASGEVKLAISNAQGNQQSVQSMPSRPSGWSVVN